VFKLTEKHFELFACALARRTSFDVPFQILLLFLRERTFAGFANKPSGVFAADTLSHAFSPAPSANPCKAEAASGLCKEEYADCLGRPQAEDRFPVFPIQAIRALEKHGMFVPADKPYKTPKP
jgi:hypothetical protein